MAEVVEVNVKLMVGSKCSHTGSSETINLLKSGEESIYDVKAKICEAYGGRLTPEDLLLSFGPNDRKLGRQYVNDPTVNERNLKVKDYSMLAWFERFPHWSLSVTLLPDTPPPPGVAIRKAAAMAENKDPDQAVIDARKTGDIPKIEELPAPWGPKDFVPPNDEDLKSEGYLPAKYPDSSSPLVDV